MRHSHVAQAIRSALLALGFSILPEGRFLADTLSVARYPEEIEDLAFRKTFFMNGVVVAGGLGHLAGSVFRMGHMGNLSVSQVYFALDALEKTLFSLGYTFDPGSGLQAARAILESLE